MNTELGIARVMDAKNISGKELIAEKIFLRSRLTRVLSGVTKPTFEEIVLFCDYCAITLAEFMGAIQEDTEKEKMITRYRRYIQNIPDSERIKATEMVNYYTAKRFDNLSSFLQYIRVENFIVPKLEEKPFDGLPEDSIAFIVENVGKGKVLSSVEFYILAGTAREIPYSFLKKMYQTFIPVDKSYLFSVTAEERQAVREFISNVFDDFSEHGDLKLAQQSLDDLREFLTHFPNLRFQLMLKINENFLALSTKLDRKIITETETYIEALKNLDEDVFAKGAEFQLEQIVAGISVPIFEEKMPSE